MMGSEERASEECICMKSSTSIDRPSLTLSQRHMWVGQHLDPTSPLYNMAFTFVFEGPIDEACFRQAWQRVVDTSESLRTTIVEEAGIAMPRLLPPGSCRLEVVDLSDQTDPTAVFRRLAEDRATRVLSIDSQLVDATLARLGHERFGFYLNQHHLITDAASVVLLLDRLSTEYSNGLQGRLVEPPQLDDYYSTSRALEALPTESMRQDASADREQRLGALDRSTPFYGKTVRPESTRSRRLTLDLDESSSRRLRELANEKGFRGLTPDISMFTLLASLLVSWLHRISAKNQLGFDAPVHNRLTAAARASIGLFIEMFPFAVNVEEGETFRSLGQKCLEEAQRFLANALPASSTQSTAAANNVVLNFFPGSFGDFAGIPTSIDWVHPGHGDRIHSLRLQVHDFAGRGRFTLHFDANEEVFDLALHQRAIQHFEGLLQACLAEPDQVIAGIDILTESERKAVIVDFNDTSAQTAPTLPVTELFREQVRLSPDRVALRHKNRQLTFAELNRETEARALQLIESGVSPGDIVAISMRRSIEAVVGILATLRAGAAYLPIDPSYPEARIRRILADSGATLILSSSTQRLGRLIAPDTVPTLDLDTAACDLHSRPSLPTPGLGDLAYMIYTSGSTGRPKGVRVDHGGLSSYLEWASRQYVRGDRLTFPLFTSLAFDLTVTSLFLPLISGGTLVVYEEPTGPIDTALMDVLGANIVDFIKLTPSHLSLLREMDLSESRIRRMVVGGEDFRTRLARTCHRQFNERIEIYNEYGPTEAVVGCMLHRFDPIQDRGSRVPIGSPADDVQIYVLNNTLTPVPEGVPGELCVSRFGLSEGYQNLPELTADRFVSHPFRDGERLYRTGDLTRFVTPGKLEYLGRIDRQLKLSGFRVEPSEIESALRAHAAIEDCVVTEQSHRSSLSLSPSELDYCQRCGLPSNFPAAHFDQEGVCSLCHAYDAIKDEAEAYFSDPETLREIFSASAARKDAPYDCMMLLSGGKDSTYALCQLVDMGLKVYAFSLDNGYISEEAKDNIRNVAEKLGVDYELATTPAMNAIFRDSLMRFSNVCQGCFKAIYTLSMQRARELGIPIIVTGLSRGQFFETRLTEGMFRGGGCSPQEVDQAVLEARKVYHRLDDAVSRHLDVEAFRQDSIFDEIQIVDFYRYWDVGLDELMRYLKARVQWSRPSDTGRSTNCLINDVGIYIHQKERGFHNYALPYSWDVRLGHKTRDAAIKELNDDIDREQVSQMLSEVDYDENRLVREETNASLVAFYVASASVSQAELQRTLRKSLPSQLVPQRLVQIDAIPMTSQGKIDYAALPSPEAVGVDAEVEITPLVGPVQEQIAAIWRQLLGTGRVGATTNFFDVGGNSLAAMEVTLQLRRQFGVELPLTSLFQHPSVEALAARIESAIIAEIEQMSEVEAERLAGEPHEAR